jgi:hypothetical protein
VPTNPADFEITLEGNAHRTVLLYTAEEEADHMFAPISFNFAAETELQ